MSRLLASLLLVLFAACAHDPIDPARPADVHGSLTAPTAWRLLQATRADGGRIDAVHVDGAAYRLQFRTDRLSVQGGCNTLMAPYTVRTHALAIGGIASTRMACDDALMQADSALSSLLTGTLQLRWADGGQRVSLHTADGSRLLLEADATP